MVAMVLVSSDILYLLLFWLFHWLIVQNQVLIRVRLESRIAVIEGVTLYYKSLTRLHVELVQTFWPSVM